MRLWRLLYFFTILTFLGSPPSYASLDGKRALQRAETVMFEKGKTAATVSGKLSGYQTKDYVLRANEGQTLSLALQASNEATYIALFLVKGTSLEQIGFIPGTVTDWSGQLPMNSRYLARVFMLWEEARKGSQTNFSLRIQIDDSTAKSPSRPPARPKPEPAPVSPPVSKPEPIPMQPKPLPVTPKPEPTRPVIEKNPTPPPVIIKPERGPSEPRAPVESDDITGDYEKENRAKLHVLKVFGERVFIRITGLGYTTCNFTGAGVLENNRVTIYNKFIRDNVLFKFNNDGVEVAGGRGLTRFCAGNDTIAGRYLRKSAQVAQNVKAQMLASIPVPVAASRDIDILDYTCGTFAQEDSFTQQRVMAWMFGFVYGKSNKANELLVNLSEPALKRGIRMLTLQCHQHPEKPLLQAAESLAESL